MVSMDGNDVDITLPSGQSEGSNKKHVITMTTGLSCNPLNSSNAARGEDDAMDDEQCVPPFVVCQKLFALGTPEEMKSSVVCPPSSLVKKLSESTEEDKIFQSVLVDFDDEQLQSTLAMFFGSHQAARELFSEFARRTAIPGK